MLGRPQCNGVAGNDKTRCGCGTGKSGVSLASPAIAITPCVNRLVFHTHHLESSLTFIKCRSLLNTPALESSMIMAGMNVEILRGRGDHPPGQVKCKRQMAM